MTRRNFETTARVRALQTGCMLFVLSLLAAVAIHTLRNTVVASETRQAETMESASGNTGASPGMAAR